MCACERDRQERQTERERERERERPRVLPCHEYGPSITFSGTNVLLGPGRSGDTKAAFHWAALDLIQHIHRHTHTYTNIMRDEFERHLRQSVAADVAHLYPKYVLSAK